MNAIYLCSLFFLFRLPVVFAQDLASGQLHFNQNQVLAKYQFLKGPTNQGDSIMELAFYNEQGMPIGLEPSLGVQMFMPEMGHAGAPTKIELVPARLGVYRVNKMYFYHNGLWEIRVSLKSRLGAIETKILKFMIDGTYCYQPNK